MKKLLLSVLAVLGVASVNAYEVNDFLYTNTAKFKVIGENLVTNGNFSDATTGWTNQEGTEVSALSWQYTEAAGPNGENALMSLAADEGNVLARVFELNPGNYAISYWIKGEAKTLIDNVPANANYAGIFVNNDGSLTTNLRQVNDQAAALTEWTQINDTVSINAGEYLALYFDKMAIGTMVTNFEIHEIATVYDTRIIERELAFVKALMAMPEEFPNLGELPDVVGAIEAALEGDTSFGLDFSDPAGIAGIEDFMTQNYFPNKEAFFSLNSANMYANLGLKVWSTLSKTQKANGIGGWSGTGGRWFHGDGGVAKEENAIVNYIQGSYDLPNATQYIEKEGMEPGKYMLAFDIKGYNFAGSGSAVRYTPDYASDLCGTVIYINGDTVKCEPLDEVHYNTYFVIGEVKEDGKLNMGMNFTIAEGLVGKKLGGRLFLANPLILMLGTNQAEQDLAVLVKNIAAQQDGLKVMIDSAKTVTAKTAEYPWGMNALIAAIPTFEEYLNSTYAIVDAEGKNVSLVAGEVTDEQNALPTDIENQMKAMRTAIQNLYALNQPITDIADAITYHRTVIVDPLYANATAGSRSAYETSIATAEGLKASVVQMDSIPAAEEKVKFVAAIADMTEKELAFKESCASYAAPAPKAVKNANMRNGGTGKPNKNTVLQDWDCLFDTANGWKEGERWNYVDLSGYGITEGCAVQYWRGESAHARGKTSQNITLTDAGVYEFESYTYGNNESNKYRDYYTMVADEETGTTIDTLFDKSGLKLFFGLTGVEDSIRFHSQYSENGYKPSIKTITYVKEYDGEEQFTIGFHATDEQGVTSKCNYFGWGPVRLLYGGATAAYVADLDADLATVTTQAQEMVNACKDNEAYQWLTTKLARYIKDGQDLRLPWMTESVDAANTARVITAKRNAIHNMKLTMDRLSTVVSGIEGVEAETVIDAEAKGIYSITGVKLGNELKGLQKGLYIINGKKYIVK